ncbi:PREDICTED: uncharacterized protein LOC109583625 [Amphimedon queenslandica]|uniref:Uncharacterized protein n=1 Tax=Amphimedon queenslandica TaxID=400682 RepID=A0AAN0JCY2_AMPQE|nr:PREDICTED: uncharacterized protein LOC109583625 [Amphimedon queenslandica]|eukprot:XP_019854606.1 PREDICTED: uncharacterized protein LOC109583625 [Amphimedon queenslandica]
MDCLCCGSVVLPGSRTFLRKKYDERKEIMTALETKYAISHSGLEDLEKMLINGVVCRGKCSGLLAKYVTLKKDYFFTERKIIDIFGDLVVKNGFGSVIGDGIADDATHSFVTSHGTPSRSTTASPARIARKQLQYTPKEQSTKTVGVLTIHKGKRRFSCLPPSLRGVGQSVGRKSRIAIVNKVLKDNRMKAMTIRKVGQLIRKDLKLLCKQNSSFCDKRISEIEQFDWARVTSCVRNTAPLLFTILDEALNESGLEKEIAIDMCTSIMLKTHSERASLVQRLISVLLFSSHAPKQLFQRLHKIGICVSHKSTIRLIDEMSEDFDGPVKEWRSKVSDYLWPESVVNSFDTNIASNDEAVPEDTEVHVHASNISITPVDVDDTSRPSLSQQPFESTSVPLSPVLSTTNNSLNTVSCYSEEPQTSNITITADLSIDFEGQPVLLSSPHCSDNSSSTASVAHASSYTISPPSYSEKSSSDTCTSEENMECNTPRPCHRSFKLVGDNLDKYVKPRHETMERHSSSLHYFHSFAVLDRCDTSHLADNPSLCDASTTCTSLSKSILPTESDRSSLLDNYAILFARVIQRHIPFFKKNCPKVVRHIDHSYTSEMSTKSVVVS